MARILFRSALTVCLAGGLAACNDADTGSADKGEAGPEPNLDAKADSFYQPTVFGAVTFGAPAKASLGADARFHAFDFELTDKATVALKTDSEDAKRDTVLYLYKASDDGWGRYIAKNDDDGRGLLSSVETELGAGQYRAIVKGYRVTETGAFSLTVDCDGAGCGATTPAPTHVDACLFGDVYRNITANPNFEVVASRTGLSAGALLQDGEDVAFMRALAANGDDVTSLEKAFEAVDDGGFNYMLLRDVFDGQTFEVVEFGMGDTSVGAVLGKDDLVAARIGDGDLWPCFVAEPEDRFSALTLDSIPLPDADLSSFEAYKVGGLEPGQMFSLGSDRVVYESLYGSFGGCSGVLEFDDAAISRASGYAATDFFTLEIEDWEGALGDTELSAFEAWADEREGGLELWTAALDDRACGGDGSGVIAFVHDRVNQVVLAGVFVEWAE